MFVGVFVLAFFYALSFKDALVFDLIHLPAYQYGDWHTEEALSEEKGCCQTCLVPASQRHSTPRTYEIETDLANPWRSSFQRLALFAPYCISNDDTQPSSLEMQDVQTAAQEQRNVLRYLPAAMAKCDRSDVRAWLEADIADGPRSILQFTMAAARLASSLDLFQLQRANTFSETETETQECQGQQDAETGTGSADASGTANDDADNASTGLHRLSAPNACYVSSANHAFPNATDAREHGSVAAAATAEHGEDACAHASTHIQHEWEFCTIYANHASSADPEAECDFSTIQQCSGCRGTRFDDDDAWTASGTAGGHAAQDPEGFHQVWAADFDRPPCGGDSFGHSQTELRRCSSCSKPASCNVEKVLVRCCPNVENIRCAIHGSRKAIAGTSVHTQGITFDCQEGPGDLQASQTRSGGRTSHYVRRRDRGSRDNSSHSSLCQDHGDDGRSGNLPPISTSRSRSIDCGRDSCRQTATHHAAQRRRRPSYGGWRRVHAAFWQGWLSMTTKYANLKPLTKDSSAISGPVAVLKWSHSIVEEHNFLNEYAAIENARSLALDLGSYNGVFSDTKPWTITSRTPSSRRSLGFASDVDVLMGLADEITMYKVTVPEFCLGNGIMPWSAGLLRGGDFAVPIQDTHEEHQHVPDDNSSMIHASGISSDTFETAPSSPTSVPAFNFGHDHPANARTGSQIPSWGRNILHLLEEEGVVEDEEDGPVIMVSSFYIDHETHRFHDEPRILRFDHDYEEWEADVRFIWEDMVDNQAPLDIVIVRPEPPHIPFRGTVATVIVHQHQRPDRAACLITAVHIMDPATTFRHSAHSTELLLPHARVRQLAGVDHICLQREEQGAGQCTVHIGHQLQPPAHDIAILHGLSLHIRIPSTLSIEEAEQNLCRRVQQNRRQQSGHSWDPPDSQVGSPEDDHPLPVDGPHEPEDAISFMGKRPRPARSSRHRPIEISSSSTSPETISSPDNGLRWRQTVIFTMDGLSTSAQLPWGDSDALFSQIAAALDIARRDILRVVAVPHRPPDYDPVNLHCMILQKLTEFRPTPYVRLVLVDRELHVAQNVQTSPFRRFPTWIPHVLTRTRLLTELGLGDLCDSQGSPCHVWKNNVLVEEHSITRLEIADGDYIRLYVGDLDGQDTCLSDIDLRFSEEAEEATITEDVDDAYLFQKAMRQFEHTCSKTLRDLEPHKCRIAPDHVTTGRRLDLPGRAAHQEQRQPVPTQDFHQGDFQRLGTWFDRDSLIECSDEGAIAYIDTWYIHHQRQSICREARPLRLGNDPTTWRSNILDLWHDVIDPSIATVIHLVQPPPPCAMTECVLAHLILEQSTRPQHEVGLITIHVRDRHGDTTRHGAYSLPNIMTERNVLHLAEMFIYCQARLCAVRLGALPFGLADWVEIPRAASLVIHIRPLILPTEENDHMELMQRPNTRWRRQTVPEEGLATSSNARRCARFVFNPGAPVFNPMMPNLNTMSEEIQELHQHWIRTAFSWEGETASTRIQTWFVDQHDQNFWTCTRPRTVRLYEDYTQWEAQIRQTWQDLLNPAAPAIIQVVTPTPLNTNRETAAHVLLIQRPHEVFATILTTVVDLSHARRAITMQLAITTHEHMYVQNLLMALGLAGRCLATGAAMTCQTWYDRYLIQPGTVFPARNGQGLVIQMHRRPTYQDMRDGTNLLQTRMQSIHRERQTHGQVAHTHGPRSDTLPSTPSILEEDLEPPFSATGIIYVHWPPTYGSSTQIPHFVEVEAPGTPEQVRQELRSMGYEGEAFSCGQHDAVYFHPCIFHHEMMHIYCNQDTTAKNGIHVQRGTPADDDITHMKILHRKGFRKAVITQREQVNAYVTILHFCNVEPKA